MKISIIPDILAEEEEDMIKIRIEDNDDAPMEMEEEENVRWIMGSDVEASAERRPIFTN